MMTMRAMKTVMTIRQVERRWLQLRQNFVKICGEYDDSGDDGVTSRAKKTVKKMRAFDDDYNRDIGEVEENEGRDKEKNDG